MDLGSKRHSSEVERKYYTKTDLPGLCPKNFMKKTQKFIESISVRDVFQIVLKHLKLESFYHILCYARFKTPPRKS